MNNKQRTQLRKAKKIIQEVMDQNQYSFDNLPEGLQYGAPGESIEEAIQWLEEAIDALNEVGA